MGKDQLVFISTPAIGNLVPVVEFAVRLTQQSPGLSAVVLVINLPQRPLLSTYVQSRAATAPALRFVHLPAVDPPSPDEFQSSVGFTSVYIQKHKPLVKRALADLESDSARVLALFVDMFCTPVADAAEELGIPCYLFFASPASFLGFVVHLTELEGRTASESGELASELSIPSFLNKVPVRVLPSAILKGRDGPSWLIHHGSRYQELDGIVINTFLELEPFALNSLSKILRPPIYAVGPVLDLDGPIQWHPSHAHQEALMQWLDHQPPSTVVLLCFGSMGCISAPQVREIAAGLERSGHRFLWSLRERPKNKMDLPSDYSNFSEVLPDGFLGRTVGIGLVCGWVSQVTVLGHPAVGGFISHCGWNSILESLWHGVPIATWPIYAEQQMNAFEMVEELGLAVKIRLDYREGSDLVSDKEVERGVRALMDRDSEVRRKVKLMREMSRMAVVKDGSSYESLGHLIEQVTTESR